MNSDKVVEKSAMEQTISDVSFDEEAERNHCPPPPLPRPSGVSERITSISFEDEGNRLLPSPPSPTDSNPNTPARSRSSSLLSSPKFCSTSLRSNLTREQVDRDPLFFYEVVKTLGAGSMGSVARVKKRTNVVGGSARKDIQEAVKRQKKRKECLKIPIIGNLFSCCIDGDLRHRKENFIFLKTSQRFSSILRPYGEPITSHRSYDSLHDQFDISVGSDGSRKSSDITYAMKSIHLNRVTDASFVSELRNEISILKKLDHPHIVRAIETFEHRNQIFIVMELCAGGDLYSRDPYTEEDAARILSSILSALGYMHSKNVVHRDLKYENILFVNDSPKAEVKLIDFGLSKVYGDNAQLTEGVGTIYTMAPEVLKGNYTTKADVWSIGVIAYMLLSSQMPFYGRKKRHIVEQILNCQFDFRGRRWKKISDQAKAFIEDLLVLDPDDRLEAKNANSSVWLNRRFSATTRDPLQEEENMARSAMLRYAGYNKLKKMVGFGFSSVISEFLVHELNPLVLFLALGLDGGGTQIKYRGNWYLAENFSKI
jgi:serine/threonine protein kinase